MNDQNERTKSGIKVLIIGIVLIGIIVGYYYYLSNKKQGSKEETAVAATAVQDALLYNFERNYPPTPKEVIKLYAKMAQCLCNEEYSEEEFIQLAAQIQNLYDDELIANKTEEQYIEDLQSELSDLKERQIVISGYSTSASTDVEEYTLDGYDFAKLYCTFTLTQGKVYDTTSQLFLLRKDSEGHWKIYGFTLADDDSL